MTECQECLTLLNPQQQIMLSVKREREREREREKQRDKRGKRES